MTKRKIITKKDFIRKFKNVKGINTRSDQTVGELWDLLNKMPEEDLNQWIAALTDGSYNQTTDYLFSDDKYCCLGVMCHLKGVSHEVLEEFTMPYDLEDDYFKQFNAPIDEHGHTCLGVLSAMNDNGNSFKDIANIINIYQ